MYRRYLAIAIGVLALAGFALGCGSDDGGEALTKAEFVEQGDAACKEANDQGQKEMVAFIAENSQNSKLSGTSEEEAVETIIVPLIEAQVEALDDLQPPEGDEEQVEAIVGSLEDLQDEGEADPAALAGTYAPFGPSKKLAIAYGFKRCGSNI
jgi:hypothetical protein